MRLGLFDPNRTSAYRLVHSEGDGMGLVDNIMMFGVSSINTRDKPLIIEHLVQIKTEYLRKSTSPSRREGLKDGVGILFGDTINVVEIKRMA